MLDVLIIGDRGDWDIAQAHLAHLGANTKIVDSEVALGLARKKDYDLYLIAKGNDKNAITYHRLMEANKNANVILISGTDYDPPRADVSGVTYMSRGTFAQLAYDILQRLHEKKQKLKLIS
jgi:hypothetical protein